MMRRLLIFFSLFLLISSCDKEESVPSYIYVPSASVNAQPPFGSSSSKITELWVYANNDLLGVFPLPALVPVLAEGETELRIFPGIHENGILARPTIYPFYEPIVMTRELERGQVDTFSLVFSYLSTDKIDIVMNHDFDSGNFFTNDLDGDSLTYVQVVDNGFEGKSGLLAVTDTTRDLLVSTNDFFELPSNGSQIYLEMNYRNDVPFSIWLRGHDGTLAIVSDPVSILNIHEEWNKIYIPLTDFVVSRKWLNYQLVFSVLLTDEQIDSGVKSGEVYLDNIKLLKFK